MPKHRASNRTFADSLGRPIPSYTMLAGKIAKALAVGMAECHRRAEAEGFA
jgi:hypothetical protein